ncbi:MAG: cell division protein FtsW [Candidatus Terrybacteria bacterium RIFCSPLOWO2_01_FULL_44_24]|uniref:Probable peptidoglycan glycosyltransferase FtsW n=1 Tax=Candidatus Terrybacteria bacterium RIFCSPHIGHO2_01_FULL_43_35 TaxID=1802361 RepID=A0A1G2PE56_9BACT|nr:MAG: cell division protein FtsW [Candidatus Terrybacteria bacterium RIFCSPHIGHO2_01_FULL_43_35]OHA49668.1 MAG: cell division protein FtsW [Candidatus Terrybacteria bacterium RIFCSPHIGHO2_02_FULL_43_14]OHA51333.1 MAG: cell division protein FtsW [Candidatus Terrybacteria bacterium RIFCSPLOWO2_01_FULL_44_24]
MNFKGDRILIFLSLALLGSGLLVLTSASVVQGTADFDQPFYYISRQMILGLPLGLLLGFVASRIKEGLWRALAFPLMVLTILLLVLVFIPDVGYGAGGAHRWISFGPLGFQPAEIAKFTFILYLAAWLSKHKDELGSFEEGLLPFLAISGTVGIFLILQPDISTLGVLSFTALAMLFVAGAKMKHIFGTLGLGALVLILLIMVAPYRLNRLTAFINPGSDPLGHGYQISQATLAIGSGGLTGRGFGFSRQKFLYLPEPVGDSIFAVMGEEIGLVGSATFIVMFVLLAWRGFRIALRASSEFLQLFAFGLTSWIVIQALLNMAGNLSLTPLVGITLPFVSYGSSSLAITLISIGVIFGISRINEEA